MDAASPKDADDSADGFGPLKSTEWFALSSPLSSEASASDDEIGDVGRGPLGPEQRRAFRDCHRFQDLGQQATADAATVRGRLCLATLWWSFLAIKAEADPGKGLGFPAGED